MALSRLRPKQLEDLVALCRSCTDRPLPLGPAEGAKRGRRLTAEESQTIAQAYTSGTAMAVLAKQYDVRRSTISDLLKRAGVERREQRVIQSADIDRAVTFYEQGWSLARIGEHLGFDAETIRTQLKQRGVVLRPRQGA